MYGTQELAKSVHKNGHAKTLGTGLFELCTLSISFSG